MSELTDKFLALRAHIDAATAHFGSSTHEEKQDISEVQVRALVVRMQEIQRMLNPMPAAAPEGDPPLTDPPSMPAPPVGVAIPGAPQPSGIIRS